MLRGYSPLVTKGQYFIIEDTICYNGIEDGPEPPNAYDAVHKFLSETDDFESDRGRESFILTWNPHGYLKRVR